ncbi:hypothetical protein PHYBOEH_009585 [Phytophthora boehmeriae]|uniref:Uncharacterized protein n=1 Tax=Phytophthora boehmeriae TaxID=109152 RepID=A0A8T1VXC4_9STRA|nr:hypothetical protein PHYBOEH_009585 [Phytophthora boehmeriae]
MIVPYQCLLASALAASVVNGHGWMTKPEATFGASAGDKTQFIATIEASSSGFDGSFNTAPSDNVASFTKAFKASSYKSLKAFIDDKAKVTVSGATLTCGSADPNAAAQPLPSSLEWSHSDSEGFTASHEGPCEAYCDDTRVFQDENCAKNFPAAPAVMPYESGSCSGASKLTFYWMAMHSPTWQVYVNCAPLSGSSGGGTTQTSSTSSSTADTPTVTSATQTGSSAGSTPSTTTAPSSNNTPSTPSSNNTPSTPSSNNTPSTPSSNNTPSTPSSNNTPSTTTAPSSNDTPSSNNTPSTPSTDTGDDSECGSFDVAGGSSDDAQYNQGANTPNTQSSNTGGTSQNWGSNTGGTSQNWGSNTGGTSQNWGGDTTTQNNQYNQGSNTGNTYQGGDSTTTNYGFNSFQNQGWTNAGTVSPQM